LVETSIPQSLASYQLYRMPHLAPMFVGRKNKKTKILSRTWCFEAHQHRHTGVPPRHRLRGQRLRMDEVGPGKTEGGINQIVNGLHNLLPHVAVTFIYNFYQTKLITTVLESYKVILYSILIYRSFWLFTPQSSSVSTPHVISALLLFFSLSRSQT
jgi:hypothetical protein